MRLEIERNVNETSTARELWVLGFDFSRGLRLQAVYHQSRATRRHKYKNDKKWDSMDERPYNSQLPRPRSLPAEVKKQALEEVWKAVRDCNVFIGSYNYKDQVS